MGIRHLATTTLLLPLALLVGSSRAADVAAANGATLERTDGGGQRPALERIVGIRNLQPEPEETATIVAPSYDPEQCDGWVGTLADNDGDGSGGLSESEYIAFLSGIEDPPYIGAYFEDYDTFDTLPWAFRVVHKSLACHCEKLGLGGGCCEGESAEVLLQGLGGNGNGSDGSSSSSRAKEEDDGEYRDIFCQQIAYVLDRSVPSPSPTGGPTGGPTASPTPEPTGAPSKGPTASPVTGRIETASPSGGPTASPTRNPSAGPTRTPSAGPTTVAPTVPPTGAPSVATIVPPPPAVTARTASKPDEDGGDGGGLGTGGIVGIVLACLALLAALVAFVAHRRRAEEEERLRNFAGDPARRTDLEAPPPEEPTPAAAEEPEPEPAAPAAPEPADDDASSAASEWSESNKEDSMIDLQQSQEGPGMSRAGSALAAMGAASTVTARIGTNNASASASG